MISKTAEHKQISINGEFISGYKDITVSQKINEHHTFEISVDLETGEHTTAHTLNRSKDWLGKTIVINTTGKDFTGIITQVSLHQNNGNHGQIIVSGYSSTILLEDSEAMRSWLVKSLYDITKEVTNHPRITAEIAPENTTTLEYESQYLETNFKFLQRIAKQHNEWLYYDGDTLFFGKPQLADAVTIEYGKDLTEMNISIQAQARRAKAFSYKSSEAKQLDGQSPDSPAGLNELGQHAFNASLETFSEGGHAFTSARVQNKSDIDNYLKKKQQSVAAASNYITGKSTKKGLSVGSVIDIETAILDGAANYASKKHGKYIITEITHYAKEANYYTNSFVALPADIGSLPEPEVALPIAHTQMATVLSNEDPKGKGRVQVQMNWQSGEMKTAWIRVMTPDAGSSDQVGTNRGFVFIPEKGDQVLVGFRFNDPNRPFVMGSLFNGHNAAGGHSGNNNKTITTKSGSTIAFDDSSCAITITDGTGNAVALDGAGNVSVSSSASISLSTGSSSLTLTEDGTISLLGKSIIINGSETLDQGSKNISIVGSEEVVVSASQRVNINSANEVSVTGTAQATLSSSATTAVEGAIIKLN
ncbi:type VI secretion system Vgr family protein [Mariniflexile ostreae]|uniref:Type VI secretion system Vgr family protein n=1 Tax=Mariniflexile ostreae TaxID=1520892 RepID=A0ABV5FB51_9FLAO